MKTLIAGTGYKGRWIQAEMRDDLVGTTSDDRWNIGRVLAVETAAGKLLPERLAEKWARRVGAKHMREIEIELEVKCEDRPMLCETCGVKPATYDDDEHGACCGCVPCSHCDGSGDRDEWGFCQCPPGAALEAAQHKEFEWMIPYVRAASWYRSMGDEESAEAIRRTICS